MPDAPPGILAVPEVWIALSTVAAAVIGGAVSVAVERLRANTRLDRAAADIAEQVAEVKRLATPTGNGFADDVRGQLRDLSQQMTRLEQRIWDHVDRHERGHHQ